MINSGKNEMNKAKNTRWARKLFTGLMTIFSLALVVTAIVSAFTLPPIVSISANPNPAQDGTSTIIAMANDLSHTGIDWIKIYEDGTEVKECPIESRRIASCSYNAIFNAPGNYTYYANASNGLEQIGTSPNITVEFLDIPPILNPIGNFTVEVHELLEFEISGFDFEERDALVFSASGLGPGFGMPPGAVFDSETRTFSWTPGSGQLGTWLVNFTVSDSYASDSEVVAITVVDLDAPQYSNLNANPEPAVYERDGDYIFSVVWTDNVAVESAWFEFNGTVYTNVIRNGDFYTITLNDLSAGDYEYRWFANDSSGNMNQTELIPYVINRASTTTNVVTNPSSPIVYGTESNFSCFNSGELNTILYINGTDANPQAGLSIVRSAGNYTLRCDSIENENYTASSSGDVIYTINKAVPVLESSVTSPINYTTASDYAANESNSGDNDLIYTLTRNDVPIAAGSSVSDNEVLGVGTYIYNYSTAGGENYSAAERIDVLVVDPADPRFTGSPVLGITFSPSDNVTYGTETTVTGIGCPSQLTCELFRNGTSVTSPDVQTLAGGTYYYSYNTDGNENYTSVGVSVPLIVNKIAPDLHLFIEGIETDGDVVYGATTNASAISSTSEVELYRNGTLVSDEDVGILGAGIYNYTAYALENENYSSATVIRFVNVNKSLSECFIESNSPQIYPNPINVSASCTNPEAPLQLFRGELDVTGENGQNVVIDAGTWNYMVRVPETANYLAAENTLDVVVNKGTPVMTYSANGGTSDIDLTYNETINVAVSSDAGTAHMFRNGVDVTNENGQDVVLGVGTYVYEFNVTGDANYNDIPSEFLTVNVYQGTAQVSLEFDKASPQDYLNTIRATCSVVIGEGMPVLYRNGVDVNAAENGQDVLLGAGTWNYDCVMAETQNYTEAEDSSAFVINPIAMPLHLYLDGDEGNETVAYGTETTVQGTKDYEEGSLSLLRDGIPVANPETAVLGAGLYDYTLYFGATQNFTETSKTFFLNVTKADPADPSNPSGSWLSLAILPSDNVTYGTETTVTGSGCPAELLCSLSRNGVPVSNPNIEILGAGDYEYVYSTLGNDNYTAGSVSGNLTVNKAVPVMDYSVNGGKENLTLEALAWVNATISATGGTANIYWIWNGVDTFGPIASGLNISRDYGTYTYVFNVTGNENYTDVPSEFVTVVVNDTIAPLIWFEDGTTPSGNQTSNSIFVNASGWDSYRSNVDVILLIYSNDTGYANGTDCDNSVFGNNCFTNFTDLADGVYYFQAFDWDGHNENRTEERMVVIDSTVPEVTGLSVAPASIYPGQAVSINFNVTELNLADVTAEITLPNGSFDYIVWDAPLGDVYEASYWGTEQAGTYNVRIIATDALGNVNDSENADFVVNYAVRTIINSNVYGAYYPNNYTSEVETTTVTDSTIVDSTVSTTGSVIVDISNSNISNSTLTDVSMINFCEIYDSTLIGGTCDHAYIDPSDVRNSTTTGSTIIDSRVWDSNVSYSTINDSNIDLSSIDNSNVTSSTLNNVTINESSVVENSVLSNLAATNSAISNTTLGDEIPIVVENATIIGEMVYNGTFSYNGTNVSITEPTHFRYLINYAPDAKLTTPLTVPVYTYESVFFDASGSSDLNMENGTNIALTFTENLTYTFSFGDGTIITTNESSANYAYPNAGEFYASVNVTDAFGKSSVWGGVHVTILGRPSRGGGGGGNTKCTTNWTCTEWSTCENGTQTRICEKTKPLCNALVPEPEEEMVCAVPEEKTKQGTISEFIEDVEKAGSKITGAVTGAVGDSRMKLALIFIIAILIAGGILWLARKKHLEAKTRKSRKR